jgi:hypothetical protein
MRRLVIAFVAVSLCVLAFSAVPANAAGISYFNGSVSGPFGGTSRFDLTSSCNFVHQVFDAAYVDGYGGRGSVRLAGCVELASEAPFSYVGSFAIATSKGALLRGTVSGVIGNGAHGSCNAGLFPAELDFILELTHATRGFRNVSGTIHLQGTWCSPQLPNVSGPITGGLTGDLFPPGA